MDFEACKLVVKEMVPDKKVVWTVLDNHFSFTKDKSEWKGTEIVFEIARRGKKTEINFTHVGLVPSMSATRCALPVGTASFTVTCTI